METARMIYELSRLSDDDALLVLAPKKYLQKFCQKT